MLVSNISSSSSHTNLDLNQVGGKRNGSAVGSERQGKRFILVKDIKKYETDILQQSQLTERSKSGNPEKARQFSLAVDKKYLDKREQQFFEPQPQQLQQPQKSFSQLNSNQQQQLSQLPYPNLADKSSNILQLPKKSKGSLNSLHLPADIPLVSRKSVHSQSSAINQAKDLEDLAVLKDKNIFLEKNNPVNKQMYKEFNIGPRIDNDGKIVPYTLIGSASWFSKQSELADKNTKQKGRESIKKQEDDLKLSRIKSHYHSKNSSVPSLKNISLVSNVMTDKSIVMGNSGRPDTTQSTTTKSQQVKRKRHKESCTEEVTREEVEREFVDIERRHVQSLHAEQKIIEAMSLEQRHIFTRNERVINNYQKQVEDWDKTILTVSNKSSRIPATSCMMRGDSYRRKVEYSQAFDSLKTEEERFGKRIWYMHLRNYRNGKHTDEVPEGAQRNQQIMHKRLNSVNSTVNDKTDKILGVSQQQNSSKYKFHPEGGAFGSSEEKTCDIFSGFTSVMASPQNKEIEVIRKPNDPAHFHLSSSTGFTSFKKFSSISFIESQVRESASKLKNKMIIPEAPLDDLFIQGTNKLDAEKQALLSNSKGKVFLKNTDGDAVQVQGHGQIPGTTTSQVVQFFPSTTKSGASMAYTPRSRANNNLKTEIIDQDYNISELSRSGRHFYPNVLHQLESADDKSRID